MLTRDDAEDVLLMRLVAGGDTSAFEQLIERHQALVAGTVAPALGWVRNGGTAARHVA